MLDSPLTEQRIRLSVDVASKRQLLGEVAALAAETTGLAAKEILAALNERERLGSTGVGAGVAIPHARLHGMQELVVLFFQLARPVEFDAPDSEPVDLVFVLLVPEDADGVHLKVLGRLARRLRERETCNQLRACDDNACVQAMLADLQQCRAA